MRIFITGLFAFTFLLVSCTQGKKDKAGTLNDKKVQLQKLKTQQQQISDQITALETEITNADPGAAGISAKLVAVSPVLTTNFTHYIELQGKVDAENIAYVAPPNGVGGVVKALYVTQGQAVHKGQVLARLDDALIRQQMEPLRVQLSTAEDTYRRTKNLWDQGIGTYQQVITARTQVESLQKQIAVIQKQASLMTVTAPGSGIADIVNVRVGEAFVGATAAGPQIRIVNSSKLKVSVGVPENYIGRVKQGSKLEIVLPEESNKVINASVNVVQKVIDPTTRSYNIEAHIPSDAALKPNQVAQVRILDYYAPNVLAIPLNLVQSDDKGKYVYIAEKQGNKMLARKKPVIVGESYKDLIEVKSGLNAGDQLITEGYLNLYDGQVITTDVK